MYVLLYLMLMFRGRWCGSLELLRFCSTVASRTSLPRAQCPRQDGSMIDLMQHVLLFYSFQLFPNIRPMPPFHLFGGNVQGSGAVCSMPVGCTAAVLEGYWLQGCEVP
jgi:hypothetical protein